MKNEKQMLLSDMQGQIKKSGTFIIARYQGLTGKRAHEFRKELSKSGAYFEVVRKRMLVQASKNLGVEFDPKLFPGHIGLVLGIADPLEVTKAVLKFSEQNDEAFELLGGFIDGQKTSAEDVRRMATLPNKDQMRAEMLGLLVTPASQLLTVFEALLSSVVHCIDNKVSESK